jgi:uncharacterized protein
MGKIKAILIHGNGGGTGDLHWFPWAKKELEKLEIGVKNPDFPDSIEAKASIWLPFLEKLGADEDTILIGHSSGALAAMRYAEDHEILGSVLVGVAHTDLGEESERISGYFDKPWDWEKIKNNQKWIIEFHSTDDPYIPVKEARFVHEKLDTEYYEFKDQGHFGNPEHIKLEFPELVEAIKRKL